MRRLTRNHLPSGAATLLSQFPPPNGYIVQTDIDEWTLWSRYDNCYATSTDEMVDSESEEAQSPARFETMAGFLEAVDRDIAYFICQWGIGENVPDW